ncbi:MAG: macrolide ABC transporter ATP-binding protein, partial [Mesorhizobium sp.]
MLLRLHRIDKFYPTGEGPLHVLHGIDLSLEAGKS